MGEYERTLPRIIRDFGPIIPCWRCGSKNFEGDTISRKSGSTVDMHCSRCHLQLVFEPREDGSLMDIEDCAESWTRWCVEMTGLLAYDRYSKLSLEEQDAYLTKIEEIMNLAEQGKLEPKRSGIGLSWCIRDDGTEGEPDFSESKGTSVLCSTGGRFLVSLDGYSVWMEEEGLLRVRDLLDLATKRLAEVGGLFRWRVKEGGEVDYPDCSISEYIESPGAGVLCLGDGRYLVSLNRGPYWLEEAELSQLRDLLDHAIDRLGRDRL